MRKVLIALILLWAVFSLVADGNPVHAQGRCYYTAPSWDGNDFMCYQDGNACDAGYVPSMQCRSDAAPDFCICVPAVTNTACRQINQSCINNAPCCTSPVFLTCINHTCRDCALNPQTCVTPVPTNGAPTPVTATPVMQGGGVFKKSMCDSVGGTYNAQCIACLNSGGVWSAFGCIHTDFGSVMRTVFSFGMGIAGGIAFLLILIGGLQIASSAGNPEQLNSGKELIGAAITGLLLIIFSVFLLRVIGYDILRIPNFQ